MSHIAALEIGSEESEGKKAPETRKLPLRLQCKILQSVDFDRLLKSEVWWFARREDIWHSLLGIIFKRCPKLSAIFLGGGRSARERGCCD